MPPGRAPSSAALQRLAYTHLRSREHPYINIRVRPARNGQIGALPSRTAVWRGPIVLNSLKMTAGRMAALRSFAYTVAKQSASRASARLRE